MFYNEKSYVYLDGALVKASEAKISFYAQSLNYGNAVIEGIRAYKTEEGARIFKAKQHFERLQRSANIMGLDIELDPKHLEEMAYELLEINHLENAYIRPIIFTGDSMGLRGLSKAKLFMGVFKWTNYLGKKPLRTCISKYCRPNSKTFPIEAKVSGTYVNSILAANHATKNGFHEAILKDDQGNLAQGTGTNLFIEKNGELFTPKRGSILPGITRQTIIEIAEEEDITLHEAMLTEEDLKNADAAFLTGTAAGIVGIQSVDKTEFLTEGDELIYPKLTQLYTDLLRSSYSENYTII